MNNKILIPIIGALSLATLGGLAYTQLSQGTKPSTKVSVNISSQQSLTSSSFPMLVSSSSQMPNSSVAIASSSVKVEEVKVKSVSQNSPSQSTEGKLQLEVLDSNNPPSYITDYLFCQKTSPTKKFGVLIEAENGKLEYKCPKSLEYYGCETRLDWGNWNNMKGTASGTKYVEGWTCDVPGFGRSTDKCGYELRFPSSTPELDKILDKALAEIPSIYKCVAIFDQRLSNQDIQDLKNYKFSHPVYMKLIKIKN